MYLFYLQSLHLSFCSVLQCKSLFLNFKYRVYILFVNKSDDVKHKAIKYFKQNYTLGLLFTFMVKLWLEMQDRCLTTPWLRVFYKRRQFCAWQKKIHAQEVTVFIKEHFSALATQSLPLHLRKIREKLPPFNPSHKS